MAAIYSTLLFTSHAGAGGSFTVAPGTIMVVRSITCFNADALLPGTAQLVHDASMCTIYQRTLQPQVWSVDEMRFVANPTDVIHCVNGGAVDVTVSGYVLTAP